MFKFFWRRSASPRSNESRYPLDPLSHPVIASMSQRQIADLPFEPYAFGDADLQVDASGAYTPSEPDARSVSSQNDPRRFRSS